VANNLKKYNLKAQEIGSVQVAQSLHDAEANSQLVKDYITALRANIRQWSANTKGRSEVNHSTKKPHPQKGGGRSRQGSLAAPQYKGGGRVFGPKPKFDQHVRINQKERRQAIAALVGEKIRDGRLIIVDSFEMKAPQTKVISNFLKSLTKGRRPLFLGDAHFEEVETEGAKAKMSVRSEQHDVAKKSLRNIPNAEFRLVTDASGYDVMIAHDLIITEKALNQLEEWLKVSEKPASVEMKKTAAKKAPKVKTASAEKLKAEKPAKAPKAKAVAAEETKAKPKAKAKKEV